MPDAEMPKAAWVSLGGFQRRLLTRLNYRRCSTSKAFGLAPRSLPRMERTFVCLGDRCGHPRAHDRRSVWTVRVLWVSRGSMVIRFDAQGCAFIQTIVVEIRLV